MFSFGHLYNLTPVSMLELVPASMPAAQLSQSAMRVEPALETSKAKWEKSPIAKLELSGEYENTKSVLPRKLRIKVRKQIWVSDSGPFPCWLCIVRTPTTVARRTKYHMHKCQWSEWRKLLSMSLPRKGIAPIAKVARFTLDAFIDATPRQLPDEKNQPSKRV